MSERPASLLDRPQESLAPWLGGAVIAHALGIGALVLLQLAAGGGEHGPMVRAEDLMEVELLAIAPKGELARAQRAPVAAPSEASTPTEAPPPERQSDLTVASEKPDPAKAAPPTDRARLNDLMQELERDRLLGELDAPEGPVDRDAARPDGVEGATTNLQGGLTGDPEFARYIGQLGELFLAEFRPIPALKGQGLKTRVLVRVDEEGRVTERTIARSSNNASWDRAALAAAEAVTRVPLPPDRYRARMSQGYGIDFEDAR